MYGDTLENLEVITLKLIDDMLKDLKTASQNGHVDIFPIVHECTNGVITSIVSLKMLQNLNVYCYPNNQICKLDVETSNRQTHHTV